MMIPDVFLIPLKIKAGASCSGLLSAGTFVGKASFSCFVLHSGSVGTISGQQPVSFATWTSCTLGCQPGGLGHLPSSSFVESVGATSTWPGGGNYQEGAHSADSFGYVGHLELKVNVFVFYLLCFGNLCSSSVLQSLRRRSLRWTALKHLETVPKKMPRHARCGCLFWFECKVISTYEITLYMS